MHQLTSQHIFPSALSANEEGIVAVGGDLSPERVLLAYKNGIFPWFEDDDCLAWWSPDPRMVLFPEKLRISKSTKKILKDNPFKITFNRSFNEVVNACAKVKRYGQNGTWITNGLMKSFNTLHEQGHAFSVEVWKDYELVGGLYGVDLGDVFCGESMFTKANNASKIGFIFLVKELIKNGYKLIDCQVPSAHLKNLGAEEVSRSKFLEYLA
jgi:leucyl/phenylalanyl-tRNA--protein transferase|tara:strand:+ start:1060 stop:1692 length:633 start_codon:yes stop_codon:yes gene_type:complete